MRHRGKSSKLKYEHALIEGLRPLLESIAPWEEIQSIIPGRIRPTKGSKRQIRLEIKYFTGTGLKVLAKTGTAVQEVFFVTANPQAVRDCVFWQPQQGQSLTNDSAEQLHKLEELDQSLFARPIRPVLSEIRNAIQQKKEPANYAHLFGSTRRGEIGRRGPAANLN